MASELPATLHFSLFLNGYGDLAVDVEAPASTKISQLHQQYLAPPIVEEGLPVYFFSAGQRLPEDTTLGDLVQGLDAVSQPHLHANRLRILAHVPRSTYQAPEISADRTWVVNGQIQQVNVELVFSNGTLTETLPVHPAVTVETLKWAIFNTHNIGPQYMRFMLSPSDNVDSPVELHDVDSLASHPVVAAILERFVKEAESKLEQPLPPDNKHLPGVVIIRINVIILPGQDQPMTISIRNPFTGETPLVVTPNDTVQAVLDKYIQAGGRDCDGFVWRGVKLRPEKTLCSYNIQENTSLFHILKRRT
eukprot:TRINITY_DN3612_c0_g1_i2.p1 TRINITY_DN3612_c0_g1~~TRINITY_DN3612_c0_g1_i2.p1  ORF type:complete len:306 (-),score=34.84 TRINITY_DN3612_c0_g1_i2:105-1022(-)